MTLTARQLRQPPTIKAIERVPYFADVDTVVETDILDFALGVYLLQKY